MTSARRAGVLLALLSLSASLHSAPAQKDSRHITRIAQQPGTRLLVVAPHPDDEVLGAGGLIHHIKAAGGAVRVVYLTSGAGYPAGVAAEEHESTPKPKDFREYGREREGEARAALVALGLGRDAAVFLDFPDAGLCQLLTIHYWSDRRPPYRSPYTRQDRPKPSEQIRADAKYHGEDLVEELAKIVDAFRPTIVVVPRREDQHADHCAAPFLVDDAIDAVHRVRAIDVDVVNYIVHYNDWPAATDGQRLPPPPGLKGGASGWMVLPLDARDRAAKRAALTRYRTQMEVQRAFLESFLRSNEVFSRPAPRRSVLPLRRAPCCDP